MSTKTTPGPPGEEKFQNLRDLLHRAGLSVDEVVPLFEVSRVSVYAWMSDHGPQQPLIRSRALKVIALLESIVAKGDLPLKEVQKKDRPQVLKSVFKRHVACPPKPPARAAD